MAPLDTTDAGVSTLGNGGGIPAPIQSIPMVQRNLRQRFKVLLLMQLLFHLLVVYIS